MYILLKSLYTFKKIYILLKFCIFKKIQNGSKNTKPLLTYKKNTTTTTLTILKNKKN